MAFDAKVKKYAGDSAGLTSASMLEALTQGVDYTLGVVKSMSPQNLPLFGRNVSIESGMINGYVSGITMTSAGSGYASNATLSITGGGGTGAEAWLTLSQANGSVITGVGLGPSNIYPVSKTGSGYTSVPTASVVSATGSGATFTLTVVIKDGMDLGALNIFDVLRKRKWFVAPLTSTLIGSSIDTFLFFSISFYGTGINWVTLSFGDLLVKISVALFMLIPFRLLLSHIEDISNIKAKTSV